MQIPAPYARQIWFRIFLLLKLYCLLGKTENKLGKRPGMVHLKNKKLIFTKLNVLGCICDSESL